MVVYTCNPCTWEARERIRSSRLIWVHSKTLSQKTKQNKAAAKRKKKTKKHLRDELNKRREKLIF
jgi:hypothetical protein